MTEKRNVFDRLELLRTALQTIGEWDVRGQTVAQAWDECSEGVRWSELVAPVPAVLIIDDPWERKDPPTAEQIAAAQKFIQEVMDKRREKAILATSVLEKDDASRIAH